MYNIPAEMSEQDKKWQAEDDARTLSQAEVISKDPERLKLAQEAAKDMAEKKLKEATAMQKIADSLFPKQA